MYEYQKGKDGYVLIIYRYGTSSFLCILLDTEADKGDVFLGEYDIFQFDLLVKICDKYVEELNDFSQQR